MLDGLKLDERNWHGHFTLGRLYWDKGDAVRAGPSIGRTLQLKPDFAEAHYLLGLVYLNLGNKGAALDEYRILKSINEVLAGKLFNKIYR